MSKKMEYIKDVLTSGEVARMCNVAPRTASKWIDNGMLTGYRIPGSLDRRVAKSDLLDFISKHQMKLHIRSKRVVVLFGLNSEVAEIIKSMTENDLGISVFIVNDLFSAGMIVGEYKPSVVFVECDNVSSMMPMFRGLDLSTAEIIVATNDDASKLVELQIDVIPASYKIKEVIEAISKRI